MNKSQVILNIEGVSVAANLSQPENPVALVIFAHGIETSHLTPNNNFISNVLNQNNITTLIPDLLSPEEKKTGEPLVNSNLLTSRLIRFTEKALEQFAFDKLSIGFLGAEAGAGAALNAAAFLGGIIKAIVCSGGKFDFSKKIKDVKAPTLLIESSLDSEAIEVNRKTYDQLLCDRKIEIIDGASHLFEEPGALNEMANLAATWFDLYLCQTIVQQNVK